MRILIFGGKGFIGSSFANGLKNAKISVIDNIELLSNEILQNCDILINCAGASNVSASFLDPQNDFISNTILVQQLLEKIRLLGCLDIRFITISSAAVYGTPKLLPIKIDEVLKPISPYGYHKMFAEDICKMYYRCFGIKSISLRIFSAYGNRQTKLLMWDLFQKFTDNSKSIVELLGTGKESRDFIHIDDIIRQIELVIANARFEGEALNIGNGKEISVFHVAKIFQECLNSNKEIKFNNIVREGDPLNWCADIEILADWGYLQKVNLKDGILNYIVHNKNEAFN